MGLKKNWDEAVGIRIKNDILITVDDPVDLIRIQNAQFRCKLTAKSFCLEVDWAIQQKKDSGKLTVCLLSNFFILRH